MRSTILCYRCRQRATLKLRSSRSSRFFISLQPGNDKINEHNSEEKRSSHGRSAGNSPRLQKNSSIAILEDLVASTWNSRVNLKLPRLSRYSQEIIEAAPTEASIPISRLPARSPTASPHRSPQFFARYSHTPPGSSLATSSESTSSSPPPSLPARPPRLSWTSSTAKNTLDPSFSSSSRHLQTTSAGSSQSSNYFRPSSPSRAPSIEYSRPGGLSKSSSPAQPPSSAPSPPTTPLEPSESSKASAESFEPTASNSKAFPVEQLHGALPIEERFKNIHQKSHIPSMTDSTTYSTLIARIRTAASRADRKLANKLWNQFCQDLSASKATGEQESKLCAEFLRAFVAMNCVNQAVGVWNEMRDVGIKPAQHHWIHMVQGCVKVGDLPSLKKTWAGLKATEDRISNTAWTIYLDGLFRARDWPFALAAMDEMGQSWKTDKKMSRRDSELNSNSNSSTSDFRDPFQEFEDDVGPSIVPINAALSVLVPLGKKEMIEGILQWTIANDVKFDTLTFNILLRSAVRKRRPQEVEKILSSMKSHSCMPDIGTITTLLDELFRDPDSGLRNASTSQQQEIIETVFAEMDNAEIPANSLTYSTILAGLLSNHTPNPEAARAVLSRMKATNIEVSPHISTILIGYYFTRDPPDYVSIDALWVRVREDRGAVDRKFLERMIEHYGRHGQIEKMLYFLRQIPRIGAHPSWMALLHCLQALAQAQEWKICRELIEDVEDPQGKLLRLHERQRPMPTPTEEEFWALVRSLRMSYVPAPEESLEQPDIRHE